MARLATRIRLQVSPRAGRSEVVGRHGEGWKVRVAAPPADGRANQETLDLVAGAVGVPRTQVNLLTGASTRTKTVQIDGLAPAEVERRLTASSSRKTKAS